MRLDNCHNTPLHVAEYFLDIARSERPDVYVIAELFTNNTVTDNLFVSKLGISSLIRESMNSWNAREFSRLLHRYGGNPVGSLVKPSHRPIEPSNAHAIFFDVTHDNASLIQRHTVFDVLPRSALLLMCACAYGSTRGFDELVPHEIHVVNEKRVYARWDTTGNDGLNYDIGILRAKLALNELHYLMGMNGYDQVYVDHIDDEVIAVTRHNPTTHQSIILIARTSYTHSDSNSFRKFRIPLKLNKILFETKIVHRNHHYEFKKSNQYINYLENYDLDFQENLNVTDLDRSIFISTIDASQAEATVLNFKDFPPSSVIALEASLSSDSMESIEYVRDKIEALKSGTVDFKLLDFDDLNVILYRCSNEERDEEIPSDVYVVPNYGPLLFCGLQGFINVLQKIHLTNELGHALFDNIREGNWAMEYIVKRLRGYIRKRPDRIALSGFVDWLEDLFNRLRTLPRYLIPSYFDLVVTMVYDRLLAHSLALMSKLTGFIGDGSSFIQALALCSIQLVGYVKSAKLPNTLVHLSAIEKPYLSMAAGAPHFSYGIWRNWGRDTFISLNGLLLLTNRYDDAKALILSYGSCLRHGLIPNLLSEGINARYNARDSVWWWLKAIKDYTTIVPNGYEILNDCVYRIYPSDDSIYPYDQAELRCESRKQKLSDIVQEALSKHVNGTTFLEHNAGPQIDEHMRVEGFYNTIGVDLSTGFVFGGNRYNCGTWMDKMGSSYEANNKGLPSSPRYLQCLLILKVFHILKMSHTF